MEKMLILVAVIISFIGCAVPQQIIKQPEPELPKFVVNVNSITSDTLPSGTTYIILSADKDIPTTDLQFKEFASYVNRALVSKGYVPAENPDSADIAIFLNYGIGEPKEHRYSIPFPTYGQTLVQHLSTRMGTSIDMVPIREQRRIFLRMALQDMAT